MTSCFCYQLWLFQPEQLWLTIDELVSLKSADTVGSVSARPVNSSSLRRRLFIILKLFFGDLIIFTVYSGEDV